MAGLLDFINSPEGQGLLAAGFGGLANARRGAPLNVLGSAGLAGMQGYAGGQDRILRKAEFEQAQKTRGMQGDFLQMQIDKARKDQDIETKIRDLAPQFMRPAEVGWAATPANPDIGNAAMPAMPSKPASFDWGGYANALTSIDPQKAIGLQSSLIKESNFNKIDVDKFTPQSLAKFSQSRNYGDLVPRNKLEFVEGVGVDPYNPENAGRSIPNPNKPFSMSPTGGFVPNEPFQKYEKEKAAAGAARTNLNVDTAPKSLAAALGKDIAQNIGEARDQAASANQTLNNVAQMRSGLDKAITGPFANQRMTMAQIGETLGVTGKDTTEKLVNTRNVIQSLARQELAAAGQMKGQGQITESERKILKNAESGMISDMTKPEMQTLISALEKTANYRIGVHNANLQRLSGDKNLAEVSQYYQIPKIVNDMSPTNANAASLPPMSAIQAELARRRGGQ
jgi:hypothetical protein